MNFKTLYIIFLIFIFGCTSEYRRDREFILPDGNYYIYPHTLKDFPERYLSVSDSLSVSICGKDSLSIWRIEHISGHYFRIKSLVSNSLLCGFEKRGNPYIALEGENESEAGIWIIQKYKGNKFKISNKGNFMCLFVLGRNPYKVGLQTCNNRLQEYWIFEKTD